MAKAGVMIVEDEAITALEIRNVVEASDYEVLSVVYSGEDAVKEALTVMPDLILMDVTLRGEMDGVDAARKIQEFMDTPVIYITALDRVEPERLKNTRGTGYLVKPLSEGELLSNIEIAIHNHRSSRDKIEKKKLESLGDVQVFLRSVMLPLSRDMDIRRMNTFLGTFHQRFEDYMKPRFLRETGRYHRGVFEKLPDQGKLQVYLSWIDKFFASLGFQVDIEEQGSDWVITMEDCSWCEKNDDNTIYCLICQAVVKLTFEWTGLVGSVESLSDMTLPKQLCRYKIALI